MAKGKVCHFLVTCILGMKRGRSQRAGELHESVNARVPWLDYSEGFP